VAFFKYSLIRGVLFLAFFLIAYLALHFSPLTAALIAALCAFVVSFLFLRKQRERATAVVADRFAPDATTTQSAGAIADADAEDALIDENPDVWIDADRKSGTPRLGSNESD
jgi:phosphate/sulfate permease